RGAGVVATVDYEVFIDVEPGVGDGVTVAGETEPCGTHLEVARDDADAPMPELQQVLDCQPAAFAVAEVDPGGGQRAVVGLHQDHRQAARQHRGDYVFVLLGRAEDHA